MAINKVVYDGSTLIDLSNDTLSSANQLAQGIVAHDRTGATVTGTIVIPTGNVNISQAGQTDVTNYATATVPTAEFGLIAQETAFITESGERKWRMRSFATADPSEGGAEGWLDGEYYYGDYWTRPAVPRNTTITPSTSAQTIGGSTYMMEGPVTVSAMPTGTAGTPTATKGTVSNHSVSVTPSVTNTTGYITGSTKTGTAVSVTASELVSGTYTVSASGTHDVTNYASASVASGTATASATKGTVSNHSVSVTPSVTRTAGYITAGSASGTAVTVSASELVSGSQTITQNGTVDVTNLASVTVAVEGGGSSAQVDTAMRSPGGDDYTAIFTGLKGQPTSFYVSVDVSVSTTAQAAISAVVYDGSSIHTQTVSNTTNAQVSYVSTGVSYTYSNGTLTVTSTGPVFVDDDYALTYTYGGSASDVDTFNVQVGSGATSITFTGLADEPIAWSCIFKSNFSTSSGYQRVIAAGYNGTSITGLAMDSAAHPSNSYWTQSYSNGSLTITSQGTNAGGYFHQPGYYQLTAIYGDVEPQEIDVVPLSVTTNGTYTAPSGTAYSPVTVNVSGGSSSNVVEGTFTASTTKGQAQTVNIPYTGNGYPVQISIEVDGGMFNTNNTAWYSTIQRYAVGLWFATKRLQSNPPDYSSSSADNNCCVLCMSKNSTSNPSNFTNSTTQTSAIFSTTAASASNSQCVRFNSKNTMSVFVASTSYGFMSGITYRYRIFYSS